MNTVNTLTLTVVLLSLLYCIVAYRRKRSFDVPLPPSPPSDYILGHLRYIPSENPEVQYAEWAKIYGDVIYLRVPTRHIVVLNSTKAAADLLEKRGENYSERPKSVVYGLTGLASSNVGFMGLGKRFHRHRKLLQEYFGRQKVVEYMHFQTARARMLAIELAKLKGHESRSREHVFERFSTSAITSVVCGHDMFLDTDGTYEQIARAVNYIVTNCGAIGGTPIDIFPILRHFPSWFPGTFYANIARKFRGKVEKLLDYPVKKVQQQMLEGNARPSFILHNLENPIDDDVDQWHDDIKGIAAATLAAGFDTTSATLLVFVLAMVLHPECQEKAREELDRVLQRSRLPDFSDRKSLPYIECIVQETFRWLPVVPLAIPHRSLKDDVYNNMFIPGGSIVFANIWAIFRDQKVYHDADIFNPSRFLATSEGGNGEPFPGTLQFGYGRRICPGRYFADNNVWIAVATILTLFNVQRVKDESGIDIIPSVAFTTGLTSRPKPFECQMELRDERAKTLLDEAEAELHP